MVEKSLIFYYLCQRFDSGLIFRIKQMKKYLFPTCLKSTSDSTSSHFSKQFYDVKRYPFEVSGYHGDSSSLKKDLWSKSLKWFCAPTKQWNKKPHMGKFSKFNLKSNPASNNLELFGRVSFLDSSGLQMKVIFSKFLEPDQ